MMSQVLHGVLSLPVPFPHLRINMLFRLMKLSYNHVQNIFSICDVFAGVGSKGVLSNVILPWKCSLLKKVDGVVDDHAISNPLMMIFPLR